MIGTMFVKGAFKYAVMPGIMPRTRNLMTGGLGYVPFFIAVVYQMVGLLPRSHPYLIQRNIGRYGVRHVVAEAANNIVFSFKNIDQVILFVAVLAGMAIFFIQIFALLVLVMFQPVYAIPTNWAGFFTTSIFGVNVLGVHDLAYMMLDMVFGVPNATIFGIPLPGGFFGSCVGLPVACFDNNGVDLADLALPGTSPIAGESGRISVLGGNASGSFPFPYHDGLHRLFAVYSTGLLVIAVGILSYFVATVLAETAQSGTPFGRRFNKTWAPLRIVVAFGLLMPLTVGLNSAQYLVLYAAKYGSAFASNGWRYFNITLTVSYNSGLGENLVAVPNAPELRLLPSFMFVAKTCKVVYESKLLQNANRSTLNTTAPIDEEIKLYTIDSVSLAPVEITSTYAYDDFVSNTGVVGTDPSGGSMMLPIIIGNRTNEGTDDPSGIDPVCGQLSFTFQDARVPISSGGEGEEGPSQVQEVYFNIVRDLWHEEVFRGAGVYGDVAAPTPAFTATANRRHEYYAEEYAGIDEGTPQPLYLVGPSDGPVDSAFVQFVNATVRKEVEDNIASAVADQNASGAWDLDLTTSGEVVLYLRGWAGAGIWYNRISQLNGQTVASVYGVPSVEKYPAIMERVAEIKAANDSSHSGDEIFKPELSNVDSMSTLLGSDGSTQFARALYYAMNNWNNSAADSALEVPSDNPVLAYISQMFGVDGLYSMRKNPSTHPLAMLAGIGRSLVESSIRATAYALTMAGMGAFAENVLGISGASNIASIPANFLVMIATLGLTVGFVLFYIVPFLPFIYFFFAVGGWIKGIFEAMVGAPLWALAHIRIDGNGLPGNAAMNGYFLIFEVFLRPILILFGLLASISIYSALVSVLHDVFPLLSNNVGGYDLNSEISIPTGQTTLNVARGQIDEFFYTIIYAILVYILGMASFKLIDMIPNNILRWMGQSVATFGDQREDPAQNLVSKATIGSQQAVSKLGGGLSAAVNINK